MAYDRRTGLKQSLSWVVGGVVAFAIFYFLAYFAVENWLKGGAWTTLIVLSLGAFIGGIVGAVTASHPRSGGGVLLAALPSSYLTTHISGPMFASSFAGTAAGDAFPFLPGLFEVVVFVIALIGFYAGFKVTDTKPRP